MSRKRNHNRKREQNNTSPISHDAPLVETDIEKKEAKPVKQEKPREEKPKEVLTIKAENFSFIAQAEEDVDKGKIQNLKIRQADLERLLLLNEVDKEEYDYELSHISMELEALEKKYGLQGPAIEAEEIPNETVAAAEEIFEIERSIDSLTKDIRYAFGGLLKDRAKQQKQEQVKPLPEIEEIKVSREPLQVTEII